MPKKTLRTHHGKYVCAEPNSNVVGNRDSPADWEHWEVVKVGHKRVQLRSHHGKYLVRLLFHSSSSSSSSSSHIFAIQCAEPNGSVVANRDRPAQWETFHVHRVGHKRVQFKTHHGKYLCVEPSGRVVADRDRAAEWETFEFKNDSRPFYLRHKESGLFVHPLGGQANSNGIKLILHPGGYGEQRLQFRWDGKCLQHVVR